MEGIEGMGVGLGGGVVAIGCVGLGGASGRSGGVTTSMRTCGESQMRKKK